jgi:co-chaperonin GroES (HSP10)
MFIKGEELVAQKGSVVIEIKKWPQTFKSGTIIIPENVNNSFDNGRELYVAEVLSSGSELVNKGDTVAIDIYFGVHVPSEERHRKIKIVPASGIVLKNKEKLKVMSDILKMEPGEGRLLIKLRKKENKTAGGLYIPGDSLAQDPTAQDVRFADVINPGKTDYAVGDLIVFEAFMGKEVYQDEEDFVYRLCYANDVLAKVESKK